jgi:hypothetical protein
MHAEVAFDGCEFGTKFLVGEGAEHPAREISAGQMVVQGSEIAVSKMAAELLQRCRGNLRSTLGALK